VSPQNVLISFEGDIKLCDFGIAKAATKVQQTQAGALKGKLQYMSPEQAWGKKVDRRTDIFSLGVVLYEMLSTASSFRRCRRTARTATSPPSSCSGTSSR
jgi:eukaryotic-like serine/threonine-protein kinase